jgi:hypothetical protein
MTVIDLRNGTAGIGPECRAIVTQQRVGIEACRSWVAAEGGFVLGRQSEYGWRGSEDLVSGEIFWSAGENRRVCTRSCKSSQGSPFAVPPLSNLSGVGQDAQFGVDFRPCAGVKIPIQQREKLTGCSA